MGRFEQFAFFMTGRVLVRFMQAAKSVDDSNNFMVYRTELEYIRQVEVDLLGV